MFQTNATLQVSKQLARFHLDDQLVVTRHDTNRGEVYKYEYIYIYICICSKVQFWIRRSAFRIFTGSHAQTSFSIAIVIAIIVIAISTIIINIIMIKIHHHHHHHHHHHLHHHHHHHHHHHRHRPWNWSWYIVILESISKDPTDLSWNTDQKYRFSWSKFPSPWGPYLYKSSGCLSF